MFCSKCGIQNPDNSAFCLKCGSAIALLENQHEVKPEETRAQFEPQYNYAPQNAVNGRMPAGGRFVGNGVFCSEDENVVSSMNAYANGANGAGVQGTLTNKRLYLSGRMTVTNGLSSSVANTEKIIEVDQIVETSLTTVSHPGFLTAMFVFLTAALVFLVLYLDHSRASYLIGLVVGFVFALYFVIIYLVTRKAAFSIVHTNGSFLLVVTPGSSGMIRDFERSIHLVRDELVNSRRQ